MPEGNTIHRFARDHTRDLANRIVRVSSPQQRFAREAGILDGRQFLGAEAHGKHLFHVWEGGHVVHVHLGMAGDFRRFAGNPPEPRPTVRMRLVVPRITIDLIGPPTCELITESERLAIVARLGSDPLARSGDPDRVWETLQKRPDRPIGDALLDQRVLSGVGNIYRNEALFLNGLHPLRPAGRLSRTEWATLWASLRALMRRGVREGTMTVDPGEAAHPRAAEDATEDLFYVYRRSFCRRCGRRLREIPLSGRRMFVCPGCQPRRGRAAVRRESSGVRRSAKPGTDDDRCVTP